MSEKPRGRAPRKDDTKRARRRRDETGLGRNLRLFVPEEAKDPAYHYHWFADKPGRIESKTKQDDYDIVSQEELDNNVRKHRGEITVSPKGEGSPVKRALGMGETGQWQYGYLCKKPKDYYTEDKAREQAAIADAERGMKEGPAPSSDGLGDGDHAYVPGGRSNVIE